MKRFVEVKKFTNVKKALLEDNPQVCQGEEAFVEVKDDGMDQKIPTFEPIFSPFFNPYKYMYLRVV